MRGVARIALGFDIVMRIHAAKYYLGEPVLEFSALLFWGNSTSFDEAEHPAFEKQVEQQ